MSGLFDSVREDFPRARTMAYFDNASSHPISVQSAAALHRYVEWVTHDVGEPWWPAWAQPRDEAKTLFAELLNADPGEIAFARSTVESESNVLDGLKDQVIQATDTLHHCTDHLKGQEERELIDYYAEDLADMAVHVVNCWLMLQDARLSGRKREMAHIYFAETLPKIRGRAAALQGIDPVVLRGRDVILGTPF